MRKLLPLLSFLLLWGGISAQSIEMNLIGKQYFEGAYHSTGDTTGTSDVWGWASPEGDEYAIVGTLYGTHYVRIPDMTVIDSVPGPQDQDYYYHRDIKTYRNYAYVVAEMNGPGAGVQIVDLSYLPDSVHYVGNYIDSTWTRSHNLSIDTANAMMYVLSTNYNGCRLIDISSPENPVDIGWIPALGIHDVFARNDTAWVAEGYSGTYSIWDVSNKAAPVKLASIADPNAGYCHNIWPTDDGKYFLTTEETPNKTVKIWDASDLSNITLEGQFLASSNLAHNVQIMGDSAYLSHYESGIVVYDISDKSNPVQVAHYDTYPQRESDEFFGCWGVYQYTPSGYVYGTSFEGWLHVLEFQIPFSREEVQADLALIGKPFPNPAREHVVMPLQIHKATEVKVTVLNALGQEITTLQNGPMVPGYRELSWEVANQESGIYFLRISMGEKVSTRKVVVME